jgi:nucleotide-binding universal stress UspA family protein
LLEHAPGMVLVAPRTACDTGVARPLRCREILVPLDGSSWSETALPVALRLALATGAGVTLVQVIAAPDPAGALPPEREDIDLRARLVERDERVANTHLEQLRRSFRDQGATARALTVRGDDARIALSSLLATERFDLVVMAASGHGRARLPDKRCGGVVAHLAGDSPVPLLIVQPAAAQAARGAGAVSTATVRGVLAPPAGEAVAAGAAW